MSMKPQKRGDEKQLAEKIARKKRRSEYISPLPPRTIIYCEGTKTEPHYLQAIVNLIKEKYRQYAKDERIKLDQITIKGTARSGRSLYEYAIDKTAPDTKKVWLVYDKDDFPAEDFNVTPILVATHNKKSNTEYHAIWSNECFELWLLLHFIPLESNLSRTEYRRKLKENDKLPGYKKSDTNIYDRINDKTSIAIENAKLLNKKHGNITPSQMSPCTMMFELVDWLRTYL